jgi:hypothetical protein
MHLYSDKKTPSDGKKKFKIAYSVLFVLRTGRLARGETIFLLTRASVLSRFGSGSCWSYVAATLSRSEREASKVCLGYLVQSRLQKLLVVRTRPRKNDDPQENKMA